MNASSVSGESKLWKGKDSLPLVFIYLLCILPVSPFSFFYPCLFSLSLSFSLSHAHTHSTLSVLSHLSHVQLFVTLRTVAYQAPLSMGIFQARILEWVAMPSSRRSSRPGIEPASLMSSALGCGSFTSRGHVSLDF